MFRAIINLITIMKIKSIWLFFIFLNCLVKMFYMTFFIIDHEYTNKYLSSKLYNDYFDFFATKARVLLYNN